jgi:hypothetical protein
MLQPNSNNEYPMLVTKLMQTVRKMAASHSISPKNRAGTLDTASKPSKQAVALSTTTALKPSKPVAELATTTAMQTMAGKHTGQNWVSKTRCDYDAQNSTKPTATCMIPIWRL